MNNKILQQLQDLLKNGQNSFSIVEEQIDINVQFEYFKLSKDTRENSELTNEEILEKAPLLSDESTNEEIYKEVLVLLSGIESVEAFRLLEAHYKAEPVRLKEWVALALRESKHILESSFLDESQVLISTGLGGKGTCLRYFVVFIGKEIEKFDDTQLKVIRSELQYAFDKDELELEEVEFHNNLAMFSCLMPLSTIIKDFFNIVIGQCNEMGDFLSENFIVTNVKKLTVEEIEEFLEKSNEEEND